MKYIFFLFLFFTSILFSQKKDSIETNNQKKITVFYAKPGLQLNTADNRYKFLINFRFQFRGYLNFNEDPTTIADFESFKDDLNINRARVKIGGNVFQEWFRYYSEYDLKGKNLLNAEVIIEKYSFLKLRVGQWKSQYSRERIVSSGRQQTVERSLINRAFTIDRQKGASLYGNLKGRGPINFNYWLSTFIGAGRGKNKSDDNYLMYMTRLQWNLNGRVLKFTGSDFNITNKFTSSFTIAAVTNRSKFTRFSTSGGGYLEGFENAEEGQYRVNQFLIETAFKYKGFSWQQEYHWKEINDEINDVPQTHLTGNYAQLGYMLHQSLNFIPKNIELYGRHAFYDPNRTISNDIQQEYTIGTNWFINKHNNKITLEYSYLDYNSIDGIPNQKGSRYRIQWDISF